MGESGSGIPWAKVDEELITTGWLRAAYALNKTATLTS